MVDLTKRQFLKRIGSIGLCGTKVLLPNLLLAGCIKQQGRQLQAADENGVRLPEGFKSRIVAQSGREVISGQGYLWHGAPDGGACFATDNDGWIYVSNSELSSANGGCGAIAFNANGHIVDAYPILSGTDQNCAGGVTPWGSWLSCEEVNEGRVWECDPTGATPAIVRPALGVFKHEAVAVDENTQQLYLTEDKVDGCLYRFTPNQLTSQGVADLTAGRLEVATLKSGSATELNGVILSWQEIDDPAAQMEPTRYQVSAAVKFNGGEGIVFADGNIIYTTKGDNKVWSYNTIKQKLSVIYDEKNSLTPILTGVDNLTVAENGDIYVAEDGGDLQVVVIDRQGGLYPIVQLQGHDKSEIAGVAFSPDGKRLYFSSQRGTAGKSENGISYEIIGPF